MINRVSVQSALCSQLIENTKYKTLHRSWENRETQSRHRLLLFYSHFLFLQPATAAGDAVAAFYCKLATRRVTPSFITHFSSPSSFFRLVPFSLPLTRRTRRMASHYHERNGSKFNSLSDAHFCFFFAGRARSVFCCKASGAGAYYLSIDSTPLPYFTCVLFSSDEGRRPFWRTLRRLHLVVVVEVKRRDTCLITVLNKTGANQPNRFQPSLFPLSFFYV